MPAAALDTDADTDDEAAIDALAEHFFNQYSLYPVELPLEDLSFSSEPAPRGAMYFTFALFGVMGSAIAAFLFYVRVIMPVPVPLGGPDAPLLPPPVAASTTATSETQNVYTEVSVPQALPAQRDALHPGPPVPTQDAQPAPAQPADDVRDASPRMQGVATAGPQGTRTAEPTTLAQASTSAPIAPPASDTARSALADAQRPTAPAQAPTAPGQAGPARSSAQPAGPDRSAAASPVPNAVKRARAVKPAATPLIAQAYARLFQGDAPGALRLARRAVLETPRRADAWIALGSAYDALNDHAQARDAFRTCIAQARGAYVAQCRALARD